MSSDIEVVAVQEETEAFFTTMGEFRRLTALVPDDARLSISQLPEQYKALSLALLTTCEASVERPDWVKPAKQHLVTHICICEVSKV